MLLQALETVLQKPAQRLAVQAPPTMFGQSIKLLLRPCCGALMGDYKKLQLPGGGSVIGVIYALTQHG